MTRDANEMLLFWILHTGYESIAHISKLSRASKNTNISEQTQMLKTTPNMREQQSKCRTNKQRKQKSQSIELMLTFYGYLFLW